MTSEQRQLLLEQAAVVVDRMAEPPSSRILGASQRVVRELIDEVRALDAEAFALRARVFLLEALADTEAQKAWLCRTCGRPVEVERRVYAVPTCYACLPPPPPIPVLRTTNGGVR
jgi:hypothetical protein